MNLLNLFGGRRFRIFIGAILSTRMFFGNTIQAGIIKDKYKGIITYEYLCGLLYSQYLRNIYEQNVKEGGRAFPPPPK